MLLLLAFFPCVSEYASIYIFMYADEVTHILPFASVNEMTIWKKKNSLDNNNVLQSVIFCSFSINSKSFNFTSDYLLDVWRPSGSCDPSKHLISSFNKLIYNIWHPYVCFKCNVGHLTDVCNMISISCTNIDWNRPFFRLFMRPVKHTCIFFSSIDFRLYMKIT